MDGFPLFPTEISRLILLEAVNTRRVKRAFRLRFVSRSWDREVLGAIYESGILDELHGLEQALIWPKYLTYRIMRVGVPLSRQLGIIRRAAEHVQALRGKNGDHDVLKRCVLEICQFIPKHNRSASTCVSWLRMLEESEGVEEDSDDFKQVLLAVAVIVNDLDLVRQLLPDMENCLYMLSQDGVRSRQTIIAYPVDIAACKGYTEALQALLASIKCPVQLERAQSNSIHCASKGGGQHEIYNLFSRPTYFGDLVHDLYDITHTDLFDRILTICKDQLKPEWNIKSGDRMDDSLTEFLWERFQTAAQRGEVAMMKHLVHIGLKPLDHEKLADDEANCRLTIITKTAATGYANTLVYLLKTGFKIGSRSLEAASKHGNPECVKILLEHGATELVEPGGAVRAALARENEEVLRMLIDAGMVGDDEIRVVQQLQKIFGVSGDVDLDTMTKILVTLHNGLRSKMFDY